MLGVGVRGGQQRPRTEAITFENHHFLGWISGNAYLYLCAKSTCYFNFEGFP
jgi:hypothetical protein